MVQLADLLDVGLRLEHQQLHSLHLAQDGALIYKADLQSTLHDVILYGFLQPNAAGHTQVSLRHSAGDLGCTATATMPPTLQQGLTWSTFHCVQAVYGSRSCMTACMLLVGHKQQQLLLS